MAAAHLADLGDGLHRADLVVGVHHGDQTGLRGDGLLHLLGGHHAVLMDVQKGDGEALLLQGLQGVENGVVLEGGGDDVGLALQLPKGSHRADGLVVRLTAPGGKDHLGGLTAQTLGNASAGLGEGLLGPLARRVEAGGVAVLLL